MAWRLRARDKTIIGSWKQAGELTREMEANTPKIESTNEKVILLARALDDALSAKPFGWVEAPSAHSYTAS